MIWIALGAVAVLVLLPVVGLSVLSLTAKRPATLGVVDGKLAVCPETSNCVSTQAAREDQRVPPIPLATPRESSQSLPSSDRDAIGRIATAVQTFSGAKVITQADDYLHAEFTSPVFRFVDDVEFYVDAGGGVIHCRSASRVGRSDLGANRRRVEALRTALAE